MSDPQEPRATLVFHTATVGAIFSGAKRPDGSDGLVGIPVCLNIIPGNVNGTGAIGDVSIEFADGLALTMGRDEACNLAVRLFNGAFADNGDEEQFNSHTEALFYSLGAHIAKYGGNQARLSPERLRERLCLVESVESVGRNPDNN